MNTLIVYDSLYGNTEKIAQAIGAALPGDVQVLRVGQMNTADLAAVDLLFVGSPTHRFRPTEATASFLKDIPKNGLKGVKVAAFDTRYTQSTVDKIAVLSFFVRLFGYADKRIADLLKKKGGELAVPPEGFYVDDTEGPLLEGELERAATWAKDIIESTR